MPGLTILIVALTGIAVNTGSALLFLKARREDLNANGAFLHMAADAAVSAAVVLAAAGILVTGWPWLDPAIAIAVSVLIAVTAWGLLRAALHLGLDGVPDGIDPEAVAAWIGRQPGVTGLHDLHIWALSTTRKALAVHVVTGAQDTDAILRALSEGLDHNFGVSHSTIRIERAPCGTACGPVGA